MQNLKINKITAKILMILLFFNIISNLIFNPLTSFKNSEKNDSENILRISTDSGGGYIMNTDASYSWIEINETGILMDEISDVDSTEFESIEFSTWNFTFYNMIYDRLDVSNRGFMIFPEDDGGSFPIDIPNIYSINEDCVALFADWIVTSESEGGGGMIYYQFLSSPNRLVIEYKDVYNSDDPDYEYVGSFEVIFLESGDIKFQYKNIENISEDPVVVGLDHGDTLNYNFYDGFNQSVLPLSELAIEFTFNEMIDFNYSLNLAIDEEYSWIVTTINYDKLDLLFGTSWEAKYGLFPDPIRGQKTNITITSIEEDSSNWKINYTIWDWHHRFTESLLYVDMVENSIIYNKNPSDYNQIHNLTNLFPLFLPTPSYWYLKGANLSQYYTQILRNIETSHSSSIYSYDYEDMVELSHKRDITISSHDLSIYENALYTSEGILHSLHFSYANHTDYKNDGIVFSMEMVTPQHLINHTLEADVNNEFSWIVTDINSNKLDFFYGTDWGKSIGLISNPIKGQKNKINVTDMNINSTHMEIRYDQWDWINRLESFSESYLQSNTTGYKRDPFNYSESYNIPSNFLPFVPNYADIYFKYCYMGVQMDYPDPPDIDDDDQSITIYQSEWKNITGHIITITKRSEYNLSGVLDEFSIKWRNDTSHESEIIFQMENALPLLSSVSLGFEVNDEFSWIVSEVNNTFLESYLGSDWENIFGLPLNPTQYSKTKINITNIAENETYWKVNYSMWDWIDRSNDFDPLPENIDSLNFRTEPFNYTNPHNFTNIIPLFLPNPTDLYVQYGNLDDSLYSFGSGGMSGLIFNTIFGMYLNPYDNSKTLSFRLDKDDDRIYGYAEYNSLGFLKHFYIESRDPYTDDPITVFSIINYFEGPKPSYVKINESEIYEYNIYLNEEIAPEYFIGTNFPEKIIISIEYIGGNDPLNNETTIIYHLSFLWNGSIVYFGLIYNILCQDLTDNNQFYNINNYFVNPDTDWSQIESVIELILDNEDFTFEAFSNGYQFSISSGDYNITSDYRYTSQGILNIATISINDQILMTYQLNTSEIIDEIDPEWVITPSDQKIKFGDNFNYIVEAFDASGIHHYDINDTENFNIGQNTGLITNTISLAVGEYWLEIYAFDTYGNNCTAIIKITIEEKPKSNIPGYEIMTIFTVTSISLVILLLVKKKKVIPK
ncbi:MAG: hypothetical protein JXA99_01350 [Candidatus Lokiarchaeota archaeon]|nr:hypothetical protein [Candidatus Lokiarchaeota archaeon]